MPASRLLLFDIDGTLLDSGAQVREIFASALVEIYRTRGAIDELDFAGKTDHQIVTDALAVTGLSESQIDSRLPAMKSLYFELLEERLDRGAMRLLPDVLPTLELLAARPGVEMALLTGNWETGARIKLSRFDLNRFFGCGAFGDGQSDRRDLPPVAVERARARWGRRFRADEMTIVGDTTLDVACGRAHGIRVLAVTTGRQSARELERAGADRVLAALSELVGLVS